MIKDALILVAKLAWKTHIKYPVLFSAAILAATYAYIYKNQPRPRPRSPVAPSSPSAMVDPIENERALNENESLASEPSANNSPVLNVLSDSETESNDSSWMDESQEREIELVRRLYSNVN